MLHFHGTDKSVLPSIAEHGLLSRERLEKLGKRVIWKDYTREGSIYCTERVSSAHCAWSGRQSGENVVLAFDIHDNSSLLIKDRNLPGEDALEYLVQHVSPDRISVVTKVDDRFSVQHLIPLKQYLAEAM